MPARNQRLYRNKEFYYTSSMKLTQMKLTHLIFVLNFVCSSLCANQSSEFNPQAKNTIPIDLESMAQEFVLAAKKIEIPGFPYALNPSIIRWGDFILMSFRIIPDPKHSFTSYLGIIWLDQDFQPISNPQILNTRDVDSSIPSRAEDGRLISVGDRLYFVYSDNTDPKISKGGFRLFCAELHFDGKKFILQNVDRLSQFEGETKNLREKNWVPFDYNDRLLLAYSLTPHRIFHPILGTGSCETVAISHGSTQWNWGELRGGTPGLLDNGEYLAFFHSSKNIATIQSEGKMISHYFMGAYTFDARPPFALTRISPEPIIGEEFYSKTDYKPYWKPIKAIFPCGFVFDEQYVWLAYGKDDHEVWVAKLDKVKLLKSLVPVSSR